jgi:hypothetical protein
MSQSEKKKEDLFSIFAKTMDEEPISDSPTNGLNWVNKNVKRAVTFMKI